MSCNGCRVLRKGCNDDCPIRPCLDWIKSADAQANATMFLAKFYGRAGLLNLITAGPDHLRPAIFRSLLYEACGRITNPIYGSVGLLWSGNWSRCQTAVDTVLKGTSQHMQMHSSNFGQPARTMVSGTLPALKYSCDIRHIKKSVSLLTSRGHKAGLNGTRHKRAKPDPDGVDGPNSGAIWIYPTPIYEETSHHDTEDESNFSAETVEESLTVTAAKLSKMDHQQILKFGESIVERKGGDNNSNTGVGLDLTLGLTQH